MDKDRFSQLVEYNISVGAELDRAYCTNQSKKEIDFLELFKSRKWDTTILEQLLKDDSCDANHLVEPQNEYKKESV